MDLDENDKPGFTKSDKPKSIAFSFEFSSLEVYKKFWSSEKLTFSLIYLKIENNRS